MKHDLASMFVVLQPDQRAALIENAPGVFEALGRRFDGFRGHHPAGDELVCLLSGRVTMVLDRGGMEERVALDKPGEYVLVPQGTWHTARTEVATNMLFVTPGEGTQNKPV
jgi:mannose-6-phosphate isomerase-like protein (cupin superfamily)